jgi:hypothetical protein
MSRVVEMIVHTSCSTSTSERRNTKSSEPARSNFTTNHDPPSTTVVNKLTTDTFCKRRVTWVEWLENPDFVFRTESFKFLLIAEWSIEFMHENGRVRFSSEHHRTSETEQF